MSDDGLRIEIDCDELSVEDLTCILSNTVAILKSIEFSLTGKNEIEWDVSDIRMV